MAGTGAEERPVKTVACGSLNKAADMGDKAAMVRTPHHQQEPDQQHRRTVPGISTRWRIKSKDPH